MIIKHYRELDYSVIVIPDSYCVKFRIYEIIAMADDGDDNYTVPCYEVSDNNWSEHIEEVESTFRGQIKWDGISDWDMSTDCMLHHGSRDDLLNIGKILAECWDLMPEYLPTWQGDDL